MKYSIAALAVLTTLVSIGSSSAQAASLASAQLQVAPGTRLDSVEAKTLDSQGSVMVSVDTLSRAGRVFTLTGTWGSKSFTAQTTTRADAQILDFRFTLIQEESACSDAHIESAALRVGRTVGGDVRIIGATLNIEYTSDTCHLSMRTQSLQLSPANDGACEDSMSRYLGMTVLTRDPRTGTQFTGISAAASFRYNGSIVGASLVMQTPTAKFFALNTCENCADLFKCEQATAEVTNLKTAHQISCSDLPAADRATATYINCN